MDEWLRWVYLIYFVSHIPITLCLDLQGVLPRVLYPEPIADFFDWYAGEFDDHLMRRGSTPLWLQSFLVCEGLLQLPFFFVATRALLQRQCSERVRVMFIVYGAHVATTVVPILADLLAAEKPVLAAIYCPYFFVPLSLAMLFGAGNPFNKSAAKRR
eukprot:GSChrysophyteH2.ASY1.ANO1.1591.1 assembled CDS